MVISLRTGTIIRWSLWTVIWFITNPVMIPREQVLNDPSIVISLLLPFVISGVILEMIYRKLVWGKIIFPKQHWPVTVPDCPDNPWICLAFNQAPENSNFEVFCYDGKVRNARTLEKVGEVVMIEVDYEAKVEKKQKEHPWVLRPMHWRHYRLLNNP